MPQRDFFRVANFAMIFFAACLHAAAGLPQAGGGSHGRAFRAAQHIGRGFSLPETARDRFKEAHESWFPSLNRACRLPTEQNSFSAAQRQCVPSAFRKRTASYRSQLRGDALAESRLSPEQHAD